MYFVSGHEVHTPHVFLWEHALYTAAFHVSFSHPVIVVLLRRVKILRHRSVYLQHSKQNQKHFSFDTEWIVLVHGFISLIDPFDYDSLHAFALATPAAIRVQTATHSASYMPKITCPIRLNQK